MLVILRPKTATGAVPAPGERATLVLTPVDPTAL
jgi:hypothetical protein